jgi:hypothetical protein
MSSPIVVNGVRRCMAKSEEISAALYKKLEALLPPVKPARLRPRERVDCEPRKRASVGIRTGGEARGGGPYRTFGPKTWDICAAPTRVQWTCLGNSRLYWWRPMLQSVPASGAEPLATQRQCNLMEMQG